jgi:hypothetical protein
VGRWTARRSARTRLRSGRRGCRAKRAPSKDHRLADVQVGRWMTEAAAAEVVKSWGVGAALAGPTGVVGWLAANVGIIVGQRTGSTHFFEACRWRERECVVTEPGRSDLPRWIARRVPPRARRGDGNPQPLWHRAQQSHLLHRPAPRGLPERLGTGPTSSRTPLSVPRPPVPAGRTTTPERPTGDAAVASDRHRHRHQARRHRTGRGREHHHYR